MFQEQTHMVDRVAVPCLSHESTELEVPFDCEKTMQS